MLDLSSLNNNQRTAVLWNHGPLLVLAGPEKAMTLMKCKKSVATVLSQLRAPKRVLH